MERSAQWQYAKLRRTLSEMHTLLAKHNADQRETLATAIDSIDNRDDTALLSTLNSLSIWGGAGSILDLILFEIPWTAEWRPDAADNKRLRGLLLELLREMESLEIAKPGVTTRGHDWLDRIVRAER
jgi:hypothetical protein